MPPFELLSYTWFVSLSKISRSAGIRLFSLVIQALILSRRRRSISLCSTRRDSSFYLKNKKQSEF